MATVINEILNIKGTEKDGVTSFKGIPYAKPPIGELRFAPPQPYGKWKKTLDCTKWGHVAIQRQELKDHGTPSEDCLNLNVWAPSWAKPGSNLPVYVWIHGGGFWAGDGQALYYDGTSFAKKDIVVVTINYRLGALGFLALKTLFDEHGTTGNWGTMDQILALRWVNDNISAFGGDRHNITIGGESAGSMSVCNLIFSPLTEGLFSKAILESGSITYSLSTAVSKDEAIEASRRFAKECYGVEDDEEGLETLRKIDPMDLWEKGCFNINMLKESPYAFTPTRDGRVLPLDDLNDAMEKGRFNSDVRVIIGNNMDEGKEFIEDISDELIEGFIRRTFRNKGCAKEVISYYRKSKLTPEEKANELISTCLFTVGIAKVQKEFARKGAVVYAYEFNYQSDSGEVTTHGTEIPYAFGVPVNLSHGKMTEKDIEVMDCMHAYWLNFIKYGNPNGYQNPLWGRYDPDVDWVMSIDSETGMKKRSGRKLLKYLTPLYFKHPKQ